jgi:hypothetical protein
MIKENFDSMSFAKPIISPSTLKTEFLNCVTNPDGTYEVTLSDEIKRKLELSDDLLQNNKQLCDLCSQLLKLFSQGKGILEELSIIGFHKHREQKLLSSDHLDLIDRINHFTSQKVSWKMILNESEDLQFELDKLNEKIRSYKST